MAVNTLSKSHLFPTAFAGGLFIGVLGGLIGLGGAEFRLPLLIGLFGFAALHAIVLNKAMSLIVVSSALLFRSSAIPFEEVFAHWSTIVNLLAGSLVGAWLGADWATRLRSGTLYRVIAVLLIAIAFVLVGAHGVIAKEALFSGVTLIVVGVLAGLVIGVVASLLGVAGGELLIPTLIILFGVDIKLAGSLSLAVSLPTMIVGFARYSRDNSFAVLRSNKTFVLVMAGGSILGALIGGLLLNVIPSGVLLPLLALILVISAAKMWMHR